MYKLTLNSNGSSPEDRWMLPQEHLHAMGVCQFEKHSLPGEPFPLFTYQLPSTVCKRVAGNAPCLQLFLLL